MLLALLALDATAITPPATGAVALPGGVDLTLPFPDETPVRVSCGYGPGCSVFHSGTNAPGSTNDYHALDLVRDQAGGGDGLPVVAAFSGTVVYADWATGGWSTFGRIVLIEHDLGDGHTYMSLYAHLSSLSVSAGEVVADKDEVGTMGGSGNFGDNYFTPHLHFSLYRDAAFAGGPYGGNAVVPELIDGYGDLVQGDLLVAGPGAGSVSAVIVDNSDPGFALSGPATQHNSGGYRSSFWYEPATPTPTTLGSWSPDLHQTGVYEISAFIPYSNHATATAAPFTLLAHGEVAATTQDQSIIGGDFHPLFGGRGFKLLEGTAARLELHNGTEEPGADVAFDAIRFRYLGEVGEQGEGQTCSDSTECSQILLCESGRCRLPCTVTGCAPGGICEPATGLCDLWPEGADPATGSTPTGTDRDDTDIDYGQGSDPTVIKPTVECSTGPGDLRLLPLILLGLLARRRGRPVDGASAHGDRRMG